MGRDTCLPQRGALIKSLLIFLKKAIKDLTFLDSFREIMDGSLSAHFKHVISNPGYYASSLELLGPQPSRPSVFLVLVSFVLLSQSGWINWRWKGRPNTQKSFPMKKKLFLVVLGVSVVAIVTTAIAIPVTSFSVPLDVGNSTLLSTVSPSIGLDMDVIIEGLSLANSTT